MVFGTRELEHWVLEPFGLGCSAWPSTVVTAIRVEYRGRGTLIQAPTIHRRSPIIRIGTADTWKPPRLQGSKYRARNVGPYPTPPGLGGFGAKVRFFLACVCMCACKNVCIYMCIYIYVYIYTYIYIYIYTYRCIDR